jgi:uncharacterized repeat protein (TIGR03803 family)
MPESLLLVSSASPRQRHLREHFQAARPAAACHLLSPKYSESLVRQGAEEAGRIAQEYVVLFGSLARCARRAARENWGGQGPDRPTVGYVGGVGQNKGELYPLVYDGAGSFYGTTRFGGAKNLGTIFRFTRGQGLTTIARGRCGPQLNRTQIRPHYWKLDSQRRKVILHTVPTTGMRVCGKVLVAKKREFQLLGIRKSYAGFNAGRTHCTCRLTRDPQRFPASRTFHDFECVASVHVKRIT